MEKKGKRIVSNHPFLGYLLLKSLPCFLYYLVQKMFKQSPRNVFSPYN